MGLATRFETVGTLTDSSTGTANVASTVLDVGAAFNQATLNDIHATLTDQINKLAAAINAGEG